MFLIFICQHTLDKDRKNCWHGEEITSRPCHQTNFKPASSSGLLLSPWSTAQPPTSAPPPSEWPCPAAVCPCLRVSPWPAPKHCMSVSNRKLTWAQRQAISYDGGARDQLNQSNLGGRSVAKWRWKVRERWGLTVRAHIVGRKVAGEVAELTDHIKTAAPCWNSPQRTLTSVWCGDCEGSVLRDSDKSLLFLWTTQPSKQEVAKSETGSRKLLARMICAHWLWSTSREQQQTRTWNCVWVYQCVSDCMCMCKERKRKRRTPD